MNKLYLKFLILLHQSSLIRIEIYYFEASTCSYNQNTKICDVIRVNCKKHATCLKFKIHVGKIHQGHAHLYTHVKVRLITDFHCIKTICWIDRNHNNNNDNDNIIIITLSYDNDNNNDLMNYELNDELR